MAAPPAVSRSVRPAENSAAGRNLTSSSGFHAPGLVCAPVVRPCPGWLQPAQLLRRNREYNLHGSPLSVKIHSSLAFSTPPEDACPDPLDRFVPPRSLRALNLPTCPLSNQPQKGMFACLPRMLS